MVDLFINSADKSFALITHALISYSLNVSGEAKYLHFGLGLYQDHRSLHKRATKAHAYMCRVV